MNATNNNTQSALIIGDIALAESLPNSVLDSINTAPKRRQILVTGATRGIGRAIALSLANAGFDVVVHGLKSYEAAAHLITEIEALGVQARSLFFDVADRAACLHALNHDVEQHGAYYGVVLNAGISRDKAFPVLTGDDWDAVIHTNLDAFYNVLNPVIMPMISARSGGRIIAMSSVSGLMGNRGQVNYSAAKAGLIGATKALAIELAKRKITVNCVAPGLIETDMINAQVQAEALKIIPAQRLGKPEEVAALVNFLCSDAAAYITRQVISVNGGMT
jgi:3-oxoacyl-[acyl-carrier protein] reductase